MSQSIDEAAADPEYARACGFLDGFIDYEKLDASGVKFDLAMMRKLLQLLKAPQKDLPIVHIGGTKGKGSVAYMLEALIRAHGLRTGLYISPHVSDLRERIQIDGQWISRQGFVRTIQVLEACLANNDNDQAFAPTYFEALTAVGMLCFAREKVDLAIVEVGMGGRLDATNVLESALVVLTLIEMDHTKQLGCTLEAIAGEKAGIIKAGIPVICGPQEEAVRRIFQSRAASCDAPFVCSQEAARITSLEAADQGWRFSVETDKQQYSDLYLVLEGKHQLANACLAIVALEALAPRYLCVDPKQVAHAFAQVRVPGRIEILLSEPLCVVDGCHTVASARALARVLQKRKVCKGEGVLVFGVARDKDAGAMLAELVRFFRHVVLTGTGNPRACAPKDLLCLVPEDWDGQVTIESDPCAAWQLGCELAGSRRPVVAAGSLYLAGKVRELFFSKQAAT